MTQVREADQWLCFTERLPPWLRSLAFLAGFLPLLAPYELLIRPGWQAFSPLIVVPVIISLGAVAVGLVFILVGLLGLNQTLCFDTASEIVVHTYETAITPLRERRYGFGEVLGIDIKIHDWESRPATYGLRFTFIDGRTVKVGDFAQKDEAERYLSQIEGWLG